jgi:hypothetical protein|tara:strand:- start:82 stop:213 length:132 start_codon:yes stop_codon:yes gene_type:complete
MYKVLIDFFCIKERKTYKKGSEYNGNRTDLSLFLEKKNKTKKK